jgi:hypothetical protein
MIRPVDQFVLRTPSSGELVAGLFFGLAGGQTFGLTFGLIFGFVGGLISIQTGNLIPIESQY